MPPKGTRSAPRLDRQIVELYRQIVASSNRQLPFDASSPVAFRTWQRRAAYVSKKYSANYRDSRSTSVFNVR